MGLVRFTLALVVLASHAGFWTHSIGARASVQVFFVLSGLYMAAVYTTKYHQAVHGARIFYLNRALRLWPTYLLLLVMTASVWLVAGSYIGNDELIFNLFSDSGEYGIWMGALTIFLFGQDIVSVNEPLHYLLPVRQSWSIGSELLFYLTVPLILRRPRPILYFLGFVILMGVKYLALIYTNSDRLSYFFPLGNYGYFLLGCGLYFLSAHPLVDRLKQHLSHKRSVILGLLLCLLLLNGESSFELGGVVTHFFLIGLFSLAVVLLFERTSHPVGSLLGNLSYGIYLNHFLLLSIFKSVGLQGEILLLATISASFSLSFLIERYLQKYIDRYRYRYIRNKAPSQIVSNTSERPQYSQGASV
ncbi:acyltransferase family protein [Agrobacterium sp. Azo12]|jgi:peptidoglycan/LPS O-acetylase OafA/YrhL|uniref:acyltransferase family protein n=1 Tax=Agrobacterium sp. Azo12 TaxID=3031129 RepID=UPI0023D7D359|nr:acyltransferase [Agrobacterium sp. Azo12]MDO5896970.1 acyltransferase [Agrobacterium sp. Azo12]